MIFIYLYLFIYTWLRSRECDVCGPMSNSERLSGWMMMVMMKRFVENSKIETVRIFLQILYWFSPAVKMFRFRLVYLFLAIKKFVYSMFVFRIKLQSARWSFEMALWEHSHVQKLHCGQTRLTDVTQNCYLYWDNKRHITRSQLGSFKGKKTWLCFGRYFRLWNDYRRVFRLIIKLKIQG